MIREDKSEKELAERKKGPLELWPTREEYLRQMEIFVSGNRNKLEHKLLIEGYPQEEITDIATLILRGQSVFEFVSGITRLQNKMKTGLTWSTGLNRRENAITVPRIFHNDQEVEKYDRLLEIARGGDEVKLQEIDIFVNLHEVKAVVRQANRFYGLALEQKPDDIEGAKKIKEEMLSEAGMKTETVIVEEVAHALFFASVFKSKRRLLSWLEAHKGYTRHFPGDEKLIKIDTDEEALARKEHYEDKMIEVRARILVELFRKKYYS